MRHLPDQEPSTNRCRKEGRKIQGWRLCGPTPCRYLTTRSRRWLRWNRTEADAHSCCFATPIASTIIRCISSTPTRTFTATNDHSSAIPSVMIPVSLQVGHLPVPPQFGHFSWSEFRATFRPVPKHCRQSPLPPQSRRRRPPASPSNTMNTHWKRFYADVGSSWSSVRSSVVAMMVPLLLIRNPTAWTVTRTEGTLSAMLFMVIEHFKNGDPKPVGERFRQRGRMMPDIAELLGSMLAKRHRLKRPQTESEPKKKRH